MLIPIIWEEQPHLTSLCKLSILSMYVMFTYLRTLPIVPYRHTRRKTLRNKDLRLLAYRLDVSD